MILRFNQRKFAVGIAIFILMIVLLLRAERRRQHSDLLFLAEAKRIALEKNPFDEIALSRTSQDIGASAELKDDTVQPAVAYHSMPLTVQPQQVGAFPTEAIQTPTSESSSIFLRSEIRETISPITKAVIMGATAWENTSWVAMQLPTWKHAVYRVDLASNTTSATGLKTKINKGREAMPYLTYIIDNYDSLPDVMAFIHPHRNGYPEAWHNDAPDYDAAIMLQQLRLDNVLKRGYVNLRCLWDPGCVDDFQPLRDPPDLTRPHEQAFPYFYSVFFGIGIEEAKQATHHVGTPCCAQFAVSRDQVQTRPKTDYRHYRQTLELTKYDDDLSGRVMEYMWHIIFGQDSVYCPDRVECWCEVFGRCLYGTKNDEQIIVDRTT